MVFTAYVCDKKYKKHVFFNLKVTVYCGSARRDSCSAGLRGTEVKKDPVREARNGKGRNRNVCCFQKDRAMGL